MPLYLLYWSTYHAPVHFCVTAIVGSTPPPQNSGIRLHTYRMCSNIGAAKKSLQLQEVPPIRTKNPQADQRAPKLGRRLSTAIRMILEVLPEHKLDHQTVLVSGSDFVSDENNSTLVLVSLLMVLFGIFTLRSLSHARVAGAGSIASSLKRHRSSR